MHWCYLYKEQRVAVIMRHGRQTEALAKIKPKPIPLGLPSPVFQSFCRYGGFPGSYENALCLDECGQLQSKLALHPDTTAELITLLELLYCYRHAPGSREPLMVSSNKKYTSVIFYSMFDLIFCRHASTTLIIHSFLVENYETEQKIPDHISLWYLGRPT